LEILHRDTDRRYCVQKFVKIVRWEIITEVMRYLGDQKTKIRLLRGSCSKSAMARPQHLAHNVPNFTQSVHFGGVIAGRVKAVKTRLKDDMQQFFGC